MNLWFLKTLSIGLALVPVLVPVLVPLPSIALAQGVPRFIKFYQGSEIPRPLPALVGFLSRLMSDSGIQDERGFISDLSQLMRTHLATLKTNNGLKYDVGFHSLEQYYFASSSQQVFVVMTIAAVIEDEEAFLKRWNINPSRIETWIESHLTLQWDSPQFYKHLQEVLSWKKGSPPLSYQAKYIVKTLQQAHDEQGMLTLHDGAIMREGASSQIIEFLDKLYYQGQVDLPELDLQYRGLKFYYEPYTGAVYPSKNSRALFRKFLDIRMRVGENTQSEAFEHVIAYMRDKSHLLIKPLLESPSISTMLLAEALIYGDLDEVVWILTRLFDPQDADRVLLSLGRLTSQDLLGIKFDSQITRTWKPKALWKPEQKKKWTEWFYNIKAHLQVPSWVWQGLDQNHPKGKPSGLDLDRRCGQYLTRYSLN